MKKTGLIFLLVVIGYLYIFTMSPTITPGDAGELVTGAYTLGIVHPPGYPLYVAIGKIFSYLPVGNISFRLNLMSIFFSLCSLLVFYKICDGFFTSSILKNIATFGIGVSYTLWSQTIISEVYSLHIFFVLILLLFLLKKYSLRLMALLLGLGLCNHHTLLIFVPVFIWEIAAEKRYKDITIYLLFIIGLSFYFFMPVRSLQNPVMNWGDTATYANFIKHITRNQFGHPWNINYTIIRLLSQFLFYNKALSYQLSILFVPLSFLGFYYLIKRNKKTGLTLVYLVSAYSLGIILFLNFDLVPYLLSEAVIFFIPSFIILIFIIFYSLDNLLFKIEDYKTYKNVLTFFLISYFISLVIMNLKIINKRQNYFLYDYGLNILKSIPAGGTLFIQSNHQTFATGYLTMVENRYRDIRIFDFEENFFPKIFSSIRDSTGLKTKKEIEQYLINKNPSKLFFGYKPTDASIPYGFLYSLSSMENDPWNFFTLHYGLNNISTRQWENRDIVIPEFIKTLFFGKRDDTWTCDLLTRDLISMIIFAKGEKLLYEKNITKAIDELDKISHFSYDIPSQQYSIGEKFWKLNKLEKATGAYNNVLTYIQDDFEVHNNLGIIYNLKMQNEKALVHFQKAIDISPGNAAEPYYNIGIIYQDKKNFNKALEYYKQSLKLDSARPEIYYNLGIIYSEWNKFSIAEKNYLLAITKKPAYTLARNNLGLLYFNKNEIKKAIMQFETALNYDTINLMTYYNLARVYEKLDTKTAIIKWEIYLKKAESNFDEKIWINNAKKRILELGKKM